MKAKDKDTLRKQVTDILTATGSKDPLVLVRPHQEGVLILGQNPMYKAFAFWQTKEEAEEFAFAILQRTGYVDKKLEEANAVTADED